VGADRPGDIARSAPWLLPEIAVITGVSAIPAHVEYFDSPEHVFREKRILAEYVRPGGTLVVNGDDPRMRELRAGFRGASVLYAIEGAADYSASHAEILYEHALPAGMQFRANHGGSSIPVIIRGALGISRVYAALAAIAVAERIGIDPVSATTSLSAWTPPPGRVRLIPGLRGSIIIDDTYNSSPAAALAALDTLVSVKSKRRIAVLGDMLELGKFAKDAHMQLGERAAACADKLITIGIRTRATAEAALDAGLLDEDILQYDMHETKRAADELQKDLREGDVILVKGSQSMRLERFVLEIMAEPAKASELLVRMEPEWHFR
jgi:UDP-N-acetylmuramoyl-tripeptide--D-alanyl-D-alanine ligase